ncbi:MAG: MFS transporter [Caldilineaceae bacterium]
MYQVENSGDLLKNKREQLRSRHIWLNVGSTVLFLGLTSLLTDISAEMVTTTLPLYLLVTLQFTPFQIGFIDGLNQGAAVLVKLASGILSDRLRRPKEIASAGYLFSALSKLGFLVLGSSWFGISSVVILDRIGKGIRTAPRDAMIADASRTEELGTAFGVHRAMDTAGAMLGPLLAVAILTLAPGAYDAVFVVSLCIALIGVAVIALFVENPMRRTPLVAQPAPEVKQDGICKLRHPGCTCGTGNTQSGKVSLRTALGLLANGPFRALIVIGGLFSLVTVSDGLLYLNLQRSLGLSTGFFPLFFVATALLYMLLAIPLGRMADVIGSKVVFLAGYGLLAVAYGVILLPWQNYVTSGLVLLLLALYYAATDGVLMALASRHLPAHLRATGLSLLTTGTGLARLVASVLYGTLWNQFGADRALMIFGLSLLATIMIATLMISDVDQRGNSRVEHA